MLSNQRFIFSPPLLIFKGGSFEPLEPPHPPSYAPVDRFRCPTQLLLTIPGSVVSKILGQFEIPETASTVKWEGLFQSRRRNLTILVRNLRSTCLTKNPWLIFLFDPTKTKDPTVADKDKQNHKTHSATGRLASVASVSVGFYARNIHFFFLPAPTFASQKAENSSYCGNACYTQAISKTKKAQNPQYKHKAQNSNTELVTQTWCFMYLLLQKRHVKDFHWQHFLICARKRLLQKQFRNMFCIS